MHPDKGGDEEEFKQLAKAYQALTDEETRRNWQEYGNPDGPGGNDLMRIYMSSLIVFI
jgi:preprotein translocase subunit Sec63